MLYNIYPLLKSNSVDVRLPSKATVSVREFLQKKEKKCIFWGGGDILKYFMVNSVFLIIKS